MPDFPTTIYTERDTENLPGIIYDPTQKQNLFAEDFQHHASEIISIETILGLNPNWASASIAERIKGIRSLSDANEGVITIKGANVGIGTTVPDTKLHVYAGSDSVSDLSALNLQNGGENGVVINLSNAFGPLASVGSTKLGGGSSSDDGILIFKTATNSVLDEKMRITNDGNVGIGTTGPGQLLEVYGTGATTVARINNVKGSAGGTSILQFGLSDGAFVTADAGRIWNAIVDASHSSLNFAAYNGGDPTTAQMTIANGNVGIATTNPTAKADINSDILRLRTAKTPASAGAAGNQGDICWDSTYLYICISTNTWVRSLFATWI
jgi:hypothetical protein